MPAAHAKANVGARAGILARLRASLEASPLVVPAPPARPAPEPQDADLSRAWELLAARLAPLDTTVRLAKTPAEAAKLVAEIARARVAKSYTRWGQALDALGLDEALADTQGGLTRHAPGPCAGLGQVDLGIALAQGALVESGTLILAAGPDRHRAASLLPPASIILVPRAALLPDVGLLPELLARLPRDASGRPAACVNLVTGPSSTADIELVLVRGVHGPGSLDVIGLDWDD
jgi:L-lactate dehydrogenase complex protein LldG